MICGRCGGINTTDKVCPECGSKPHSSATGEEKQDVSLIAPKLDELRIPKAYLGRRWNQDMFWASHGDKHGNRHVAMFVDQLEKVHNIFAGGGLPGSSAVFVAPAGYSKLIWAYSCMQYAVTNGFSVAPFLDTLELNRLLILSGVKPVRMNRTKGRSFTGDKYDKFDPMGLNYDNYITADVLFFTVTKTVYRQDCADIIADLMDKRARRDKGTIGISRVSLNEMTNWDTRNSLIQWKDPIDPVDTFKVPKYITCL